METKTGGKTQKIVIAIVAVLLAAGIAASCTLGALAVTRIAEQQEELARLNDTLTDLVNSDNDQVTQEDDVRVAGEYWIRSTLPISDAYRSGDDSALDDTQKETLKMASDILDEIITEGMSDYEKEKAVYDWMCANLHHEGGITVAIPTTSESSSQPYGVLKYGAAVCVGFATTFRLFMQMMDIECMVVHNSYHSWDLVKLDGDWYHTDIYSDVGEGNYMNFNMTDGMCSSGHNWDTSFYPAATGLTYCYAYQNATELDDVYQLPALVRDAADQGGPAGLYFLIKGEQEGWYPILTELMSQMDNTLWRYGAEQERELGLNWNLLQAAGDDYLLSVVIYDYTGEPGEDPLSEEELERVAQAMREAFGSAYDGEDPDWDIGWTEDGPFEPVEAVG